ncbi:glycine cleavage T protein (aminomethyl transferase) [Shewanella denitrificans OS217]|jgi:tRNA-modifying protein YgfZ|uniref:Glycine cleavage T protein (Aminomethyl transferase) n=1 Tax=Shewanella denitrificans (strain OS217 / ATCC BAA-1090 / DSM 15013) TaxID=318161 RepID=Q12JZ2_SHEDO|nr:tRNA-modifying protein YgfZ [Shewanella denitrificans]ABE56234.1 glycine cleavage T protein (aminomethyl transferase) [Shewanella denitrificans OS217]
MSVSTQSMTDFYPVSEINAARLSHFGMIEITGEQAKTFINGQVTTDIISMTDEEWRWGAHCDPKGKMIASFRIFLLGERLLMLMPKSTLALDLAQLKKYAVFSKAELTDVSDSWAILGLWGEKSVDLMTQHFGELTQGLTATEQGAILKDNFGFMAILPQEQANIFIEQAKLELVAHKAWQALEIAAGYPNIDSQHSGQYVPQMCNLQAVNGISFTKGCYMGQETIARMKYRGGNKRALYILEGTTQRTLSTESQVEIQLEGGYRKVGNVIEVVQEGERVLMTAVLANDTEADAVLRMAEDESSSLAIKALPYSLTEE